MRTLRPTDWAASRRTALATGGHARLLGVLAVVLGVALGVVLATLLWPASSWAAPGDADPDSSIAVVGVRGLTWSDLTPSTTPTLARMARSGTSAALVARGAGSRMCKAEAWSVLANGSRSAGEGGSPCRGRPSDPSSAPSTDGDVVAQTVGDSELARRLEAVGVCLSFRALGAGEPACPDGQGRVDLLTGDELATQPSGPSGTLAAVDERVARLLTGYDEVLVVGLGDDDGPVALRPFIGWSAAQGRRAAWSPSTRQEGLVQLTDVTATVLERAGADSTGLEGRPIQTRPQHDPQFVAAYRALSRHAEANREAAPVALGTLWLLVIAAAGAVATRRGGSWPGSRRPRWSR